ncbi:MAG: hypothetical protein LJF15_14085, partial [Acidobacteria bacterium]|nr:hypothetical protein [Acidobacteriota bacterium]
YDAARARLRLSEALLAQGNRAGAALEAEAARSQFDRLGARPDAPRAAKVLPATGVQGTA